MTLDATGARRAEVAHPKISDIDSQRMVIHIRGGKGRKDRDVMLSPKLLDALRVYWRGLRRKPTDWLFPGNRWHTASHPVSTKVLWSACQQAAERAGLERKRIHPHNLRRYAESRTMPNRFEGCAFGVELATKAIPIDVGIGPRQSEALQESKQVIVGLIATGFGVDRSGFRKDLLLRWRDWHPGRSESFRQIRVPAKVLSESDLRPPATTPLPSCAEEHGAKHAYRPVTDRSFAPLQRTSRPDTELRRR